MNKRQAIAELAKYLPPDRLYQIVQALAPELLAIHDVPIVNLAPARTDGHISYQEAQARKLCCYCGNPGVLYSGPERDDQDFQAYQCMTCERIFYISKEATE